MAAVDQKREGEFTLEELEIGKVYRIEFYYRPSTRINEPHKLIDTSLRRFDGPSTFYGNQYMQFTVVDPGTSDLLVREENTQVETNNNPSDEIYYRFFKTAQDSIVPRFEPGALESVFKKHLRLDNATIRGLTHELLAPSNIKKPDSSKKSGGRKYKTRQIKLRRKNKTKKNRRRTNRR